VILKGPNKPETLTKSYRPITLLSHLRKVLEKVDLRKLVSPIADTIPKQQSGRHNGFSMTGALPKPMDCAEISQS